MNEKREIRTEEENEDGHNGGHMPAGASRRRREQRRQGGEGRGECAPLSRDPEREKKIMRCFCIIRYIQTLPVWRTRCIRPERPAGCNEKSPSVARG